MPDKNITVGDIVMITPKKLDPDDDWEWYEYGCWGVVNYEWDAGKQFPYQVYWSDWYGLCDYNDFAASELTPLELTVLTSEEG